MTVRSEAAKGRTEGLTALRDRLADALDDPTSTDVRSLSAVAGQLRKVLAEIDEFEPPAENFVDDMVKRRAERLARLPKDRPTQRRPGTGFEGG